MTAVHDIDARPQKLGFRHTILKLLINRTLPADTEFVDAWQVYDHALGHFIDSEAAIRVIRSLDALEPGALAKCEAEYDQASMFLSNAISAILRAPCIRPQNMRRKLALAMAEGANASQVVSLMADLDALDVWLSARG
jgi:hypothetical protein